MEGGITRQRAYIWLALALLIILGVSLAWIHSRQHPSNPVTAPVSDSIVALLEQQSDTPHSPTPHHSFSSRPHYSSRPAHSTSPTSSSIHYTPRKTLTFELNSADSIDLVQLYNIGPTIAHRIIRYRALLGGFVNIEQLREVYGIDSARFADIAPHLYVDPLSIQLIDINQADIAQLKRHPYLDYYQAKAIVTLRQRSGSYHTTADLLNIPIIEKETFTKIQPYLTCNSQPSK